MGKRAIGVGLEGCKKCHETPTLEEHTLPDGRTLYRYDHFEHQNFDAEVWYREEGKAREFWNFKQLKK